jgi:hypothetical protein
MTENEKQAFSRKDAAKYLGVCLNTLDRAGIPRVRIARRVIYRRSALDKWLEEREEPCEPKRKG